jgi:GpV Apex motif
MIGGSLRLAKLQSINPSSNAATLLMLDDGSLLPGVQIMMPHASTNSGNYDLPVPTPPPSGSNLDPTLTRSAGGRDLIAVVAFAGRTPVVMGFLTSQIGQCTFATPGFSVYRHQSDVYRTIDADADIELAHPSGSFVRLAESPDHVDLTGTDVDQQWKIAANTGSAPYFNLIIKNAGHQVAQLQLDPEGNMVLDIAGNLTATVGGNLTATIDGTASVDSTGDMTLTAPLLTIDAPVQVNGTVTATGDVKAGTISLEEHVHGGVQSGGSDTTGPIG